MKYDPYSLTELIRNDDFIAWVLHPDEELDARWNVFLHDNPEKKNTVESAREYVILLARDTGRHMPTPQQSDKMRRMVEEHMRREDGQTEIIPLNSGWRWTRVAASVAVIFGVGMFSYWFYNKGSERELGVSSVHVIASREADQMVRVNTAHKPMMVLLPDGSSVVLDPAATISFSKKNWQNQREVTLSGKAFFEIAKDPQRPFLVYSHGLATKVLGTSFLIDASKDDVKVQVTTGVVRVFSVKDLSETQKQKHVEEAASYGMLLEHDQGIAFSKENGEIVKLPDLVASNIEGNNTPIFVFDETPVEQVFKQLETTYNVKIIYDKANWASFPLNATLTGKPFISKLEVICNALDAVFTIQENEVRIKPNPNL